MKINVTELPAFSQPVVGNVYSVSGGYGRKAGHAMLLIAIAEGRMAMCGPLALMLVIDNEGNPVGVTSYGLHAIEQRSPIAFVPGLSDLTFTMEAIR